MPAAGSDITIGTILALQLVTPILTRHAPLNSSSYYGRNPHLALDWRETRKANLALQWAEFSGSGLDSVMIGH